MNKELIKICQPVEIDAIKKIKEINDMPILTRENFETGSEWLKCVVKTEKEFKNVLKEKIAPHKAEIDAIKAAFEKPLELLAEAQKIARDKLNAYVVAERQIKEAEAQKIMAEKAKAAAKELKKLDRKDASAGKFDAVTQAAIHEYTSEKRAEILADAAKPVDIVQSGDNATVRMVWDFDIVNIKDVPSEYLTVNTTVIRSAIRSGVREIPGLKIYQKPTVAIK